MALEDRKLWGEVHRDLPSLYQNNVTAPVRVNHRGELFARTLGKTAYNAADAGKYFIYRNATPGTGTAGIAAADAVDDLEGFFYLRNTATAAEGTRLFVDYLQIRVTVPGASSTTTDFYSKIDTGNSRYASGGAAVSAINVNMASSATPSATLYAGAVVTTAATTSARLLSARQIRSVIAVAGDIYTFDFGAPARGLINTFVTTGTAIAHVYVPHCPVVIGPADAWHFGLWGASHGTAAQYEYELGVVEG